MEQIKSSTGFTGSLAEFFTFLRSDPRFFYKTGAELLEAYRALCQAHRPGAGQGDSARCPACPTACGRSPTRWRPNTTTAYANPGAPDGSRPAYFFVNLYKPETRPKWEMLALTLHEAVPGHCLQRSLALGAGRPAGVPPPRRLHGLRRGLGAVRRNRSARRWASMTTTPIRASASSPTRCGAPCGSSSIRACTSCDWDRERAIELLHGQRREDRARRHQRDRSLHLVAGPGARLQGRRAEDQGAPRTRAASGSASASTSARSTTAC